MSCTNHAARFPPWRCMIWPASLQLSEFYNWNCTPWVLVMKFCWNNMGNRKSPCLWHWQCFILTYSTLALDIWQTPRYQVEGAQLTPVLERLNVNGRAEQSTCKHLAMTPEPISSRTEWGAPHLKYLQSNIWMSLKCNIFINLPYHIINENWLTITYCPRGSKNLFETQNILISKYHINNGMYRKKNGTNKSKQLTKAGTTPKQKNNQVPFQCANQGPVLQAY